MAFTSAEDLGGYSTTDQDAFSETGETGYTDYSSYDSPNQSSGPSGGGLLGGGNFFSRQMQGVDPRYSHLTTVQDMYDKGWTKEHLNAAGNIILRNREKKSYLDKATEQYGGIGTEVPGGMNSEQWEQYQQIPVSPVDFSKPPTGQNPNFDTIVNPYVPTDAIKGTQGSILNQDYTGAQGEQTANWARGKAFEYLPFDDPKPWLDNKRKEFRSDVGDAFKTGIGAVGDVIGDGWDWMTEAQANKVDSVEPSVGNTTPTQPTENPYLTPANIEKYNDIMKQDKARGTDTLYNQGPQGVGGTSFSPNRWNDIAKAANTQASASQSNVPPNLARAYNAKANMANAKHVADSGQIMTDAITLPERGQMSDKQVVEVLNRRPDASTIHAVDYEPYGSNGYASLLGVPIGEMQDSYKPVYSDEDQNAINNWRMGTDLYNTRGGMSDADQASISRGNFDVYPENFVMIDGKPVSRNNLGSNGGADGGFNFNFNMPGIGSISNMGGRQESLGPKNSMGFPNPYTGEVQKPSIDYDESLGIEPMTLSPEQQNNLVNVVMSVTPQARIAMFGKAAVEYAMKVAQGVVSKFKTPHLNTLANQSFRKDNVPTVTELGLMKAAVRNKAGLGTHTPKELGTINRNITKADQHPNFLSNKAFRKARIDRGEVTANVHPNTLNPSKNVPAIVHKQPPKGTTRDLGGMGAKGANKEDVRNMATALKLEANKKRTKLMADNKRIIAKNKKAKAKKAKKANKKRK